MVRFRTRWGFGLGSGASLVSLEVSLGAERVRGGGRECILGEMRWSGLRRGWDLGWGDRLVWCAWKLVSGPRGSGVVVVSAYWVGVGGQGEGEVGILVGVWG